MKVRHTMVGALAVLTLGAPALAGCGSDSDRLVVYSGRTENLIKPLLDDFSEESGIGIDVRYDDSANLALLIDEEGDASPADVFISQSPGAVGFLDAALARRLEEIFEDDARHCRELDADTWRRRGLWHRLQDNALYLFNEVL